MNFDRFSVIARSARELFPGKPLSLALYDLELYKYHNYSGPDRAAVLEEIRESREIVQKGIEYRERFPELSEEAIFWEISRESKNEVL